MNKDILECHDVPVDIICTPSRVIRTCTNIKKPNGIVFDSLSEQMINDIGAIKELI